MQIAALPIPVRRAANHAPRLSPQAANRLKLRQPLRPHTQRRGFTGRIPAAIGSLSNLTLISFRDNELSGSIPSELGNLSDSGRLRFDCNALSGSIPAEIGIPRRLFHQQQRIQRDGSVVDRQPFPTEGISFWELPLAPRQCGRYVNS